MSVGFPTSRNERVNLKFWILWFPKIWQNCHPQNQNGLFCTIFSCKNVTGTIFSLQGGSCETSFRKLGEACTNFGRNYLIFLKINKRFLRNFRQAPNKFHEVRLVYTVGRAQRVSLLWTVVGIVSLKCNTAYFNIGTTSLKNRAGHPTIFLLPDKQQCYNPTNCLVRASTTMRQILGSGSWDRGNVFSNNVTWDI